MSWTASSSQGGCSTAQSPLDETPEGYRAMADREALKVLVRP